jgi:hypothetical protein
MPNVTFFPPAGLKGECSCVAYQPNCPRRRDRSQSKLLFDSAYVFRATKPIRPGNSS